MPKYTVATTSRKRENLDDFQLPCLVTHARWGGTVFLLTECVADRYIGVVVHCDPSVTTTSKSNDVGEMFECLKRRYLRPYSGIVQLFNCKEED